MRIFLYTKSCIQPSLRSMLKLVAFFLFFVILFSLLFFCILAFVLPLTLPLLLLLLLLFVLLLCRWCCCWRFPLYGVLLWRRHAVVCRCQCAIGYIDAYIGYTVIINGSHASFFMTISNVLNKFSLCTFAFRQWVYAYFVHFIMKISHQMTEWIQTGVFSFRCVWSEFVCLFEYSCIGMPFMDRLC